MGSIQIGIPGIDSIRNLYGYLIIYSDVYIALTKRLKKEFGPFKRASYI